MNSAGSAELGGVIVSLTSDTTAKLNAALPPTWSKADPIDIAGDADAARYLAALDIMLADPASDAVLVMNVETAVASAAGIAEAVAERVKTARAQKYSTSKPVLAAWVGTDQSVAPIFDKAEIPHFQTEDDAVRAFMHPATTARPAALLAIAGRGRRRCSRPTSTRPGRSLAMR